MPNRVFVFSTSSPRSLPVSFSRETCFSCAGGHQTAGDSRGSTEFGAEAPEQLGNLWGLLGFRLEQREVTCDAVPP